MATITTKVVGHVVGNPGGFGTPTASIDANVGTPEVEVTASGPDTAKVFDFQFRNIKGVKGDQGDKGNPGDKGDTGNTGYHVASVTKKSGDGAPGHTDIYSMKINDAGSTEVGTFSVYNGIDGLGAGDMTKLIYDTDGDGNVNRADLADAVPWSGVTDKPLGTANGIAQLDASGKVPASQLPSFVDDVLEYDTQAGFPATGESGKIYLDASTNMTYRWGGSDYVMIGSDLALGETSSTAYRGDRGAAAYTHSQTNSVHCTEEYSVNDVENIWNTIFTGGDS